MPKEKKKKQHHSELVRLTFRLSDETVAMFKTIAAIKRMKLEELGEEAIEEAIKKHKKVIRELSEKY